jgi:hypothetical protein
MCRCVFPISNLASCRCIQQRPGHNFAIFLRCNREFRNGTIRYLPRPPCPYYWLIVIAYLPAKIRSDYGSENYEIAAVQNTLHQVYREAGGVPTKSTVPYAFGPSMHNQKIECFWSQMIEQWECDWCNHFEKMELDELWESDRPCDQAALLYIYMPLLRGEIELFRAEYNTYPRRKNPLSRLPSGPADDSFLLSDHNFSIALPRVLLDDIRRIRAPANVGEYLPIETTAWSHAIMQRSPHGRVVSTGNAKDQYIYLRDELVHGGYEHMFSLLLPKKNQPM